MNISILNKRGGVRDSGIELLRIVALLMVIIIHYSDKALKLLAVEDGVYNLLFLRSLSSGAVDIFIIISGFFMCTNIKRPLGKPASLLAQVIYRSLLVYALFLVLKVEPFSVSILATKFIPVSYYPILFCVLYLISPWLNLMFLQKKSLPVFMLVLIAVFSVWPTLVDLSEEIIGFDWFGLSSIGAKGAQAGFNIVNFILMYYIGGYLRLGELPAFMKNKKWLIIMSCISTLIIFVWALLVFRLPRREMMSAMCYHNPFVILLSVCLFLLFKEMHFKSAFVNALAKTTYLCFLIHSGIIAGMDIGIAQACEKGFWFLMLHYCVFTIAMFALSGIALFIYNKLINPFFDKLNRFEIPYNLETQN